MDGPPIRPKLLLVISVFVAIHAGIVAGANCGDAQSGPTPCSAGEYCQPWNPSFYQCRKLYSACGVQETGVDYFGNDLTSLSVLLPEDCCDTCRKTEGCKAYTFVNFNADGQPRCYLKSGSGTKIAVPGAVSALISAPHCAALPYTRCGNTQDGTSCCPDDFYCQPWDINYYQCVPIPDKCPQQLPNVDFVGNDRFRTLGLKYSAECCDLCGSTPGCKAYTFINDDPSGQPACYMKNDVGEQRWHPTAVSGVLN